MLQVRRWRLPLEINNSPNLNVYHNPLPSKAIRVTDLSSRLMWMPPTSSSSKRLSKRSQRANMLIPKWPKLPPISKRLKDMMTIKPLTSRSIISHPLCSLQERGQSRLKKHLQWESSGTNSHKKTSQKSLKMTPSNHCKSSYRAIDPKAQGATQDREAWAESLSATTWSRTLNNARNQSSNNSLSKT